VRIDHHNPIIPPNLIRPFIDRNLTRSFIDRHLIRPIIDRHLIRPFIDRNLIRSFIDRHLIRPIIDRHLIRPLIDRNLIRSLIDRNLIRPFINRIGPIIDHNIMTMATTTHWEYNPTNKHGSDKKNPSIRPRHLYKCCISRQGLDPQCLEITTTRCHVVSDARAASEKGKAFFLLYT
jgi:hypothetical protein